MKKTIKYYRICCRAPGEVEFKFRPGTMTQFSDQDTAVTWMNRHASRADAAGWEWTIQERVDVVEQGEWTPLSCGDCAESQAAGTCRGVGVADHICGRFVR